MLGQGCSSHELTFLLGEAVEKRGTGSRTTPGAKARIHFARFYAALKGRSSTEVLAVGSAGGAGFLLHAVKLRLSLTLVRSCLMQHGLSRSSVLHLPAKCRRVLLLFY